MTDGIVRLGSAFATQLGFTSDRFTPDSYLWLDGDAVMVSFVMSTQPGKGNFRRMVARCHALGLTVKIPTPLGRMLRIVIVNGYRRAMEHDEVSGEQVEVWVLAPPSQRSAY